MFLDHKFTTRVIVVVVNPSTMNQKVLSSILSEYCTPMEILISHLHSGCTGQKGPPHPGARVDRGSKPFSGGNPHGSHVKC